MDAERLIGRAAVIVPLVHIVTCGLYIAGYAKGFGDGVGSLFGPTDFFTVTLQHLLSLYLLALLSPVVTILARHRVGYSYVSDAIEAEQDIDRKAILIRQQRFMLRIVYWLPPLVAAPFLVLSALSWYVGTYVDYYLCANLLMLALMPLWWTATKALRLYGLPVELAWAALNFAVAVYGLGINSGVIDRRMTYKQAAYGSMHCKDRLVLAPVGSRFIALTPDERRHVIDEECKVVFTFPALPPLATGTLYDLISAKFRPQGRRSTTAPSPSSARTLLAPTSEGRKSTASGGENAK